MSVVNVISVLGNTTDCSTFAGSAVHLDQAVDRSSAFDLMTAISLE